MDSREPGCWSRALFVASLAGTLVLVRPVLAVPEAHTPERPTNVVPAPIPQAGDEVTTLTQNQLWLTLANFGTFGNLFVSRVASLEYPGLSGYEHLTDAGIWIGARTLDGGGTFTGVSTAAEDASLGIPTSTKTEFTPTAPSFLRRSTNPASPWYSPDAVSDLDLICTYTDTPARTGTFQPPRPLGVEVRQVVYSWSSPALGDVVFMRYVITARAAPLLDLWAGTFVEMASGAKSAYTNWPPSSGDPSGMGGWFSKKLVVWEPSLRLLREHYCRNLPAPSACMFSVAPPWIGLQLLTPPGAGQAVTVAAWPWGPNTPPHDTDVGRYGLMSAGTIADFTSAPLAPVTGDPVEVLALGPFPTVLPGDSVIVDFAWVGGSDEAAILTHAQKAQAMRDANFNPILAVAPRAGATSLHIESLGPNPSSGVATRLAFHLPAAGDATVQIVDVSGRVVFERVWSGLDAGAHTRSLEPFSPLPPGVYLVRLSQGGRVATRRAVVLR